MEKPAKLFFAVLPLALGLVAALEIRADYEQHFDVGDGQSEEELFSFNPLSIKRDPFVPPAVEARKVGSALELYDLAEIRLVGILSGAGTPQAMLSLPNGETHIVRGGDKVGRHNGRVHRVTDTEVIVRESFKNFKGQVKQELNTLRLAR